jgi:predicted Rossmann fold nucleotide-binding protein DprA/Smf involved in DNA uptake
MAAAYAVGGKTVGILAESLVRRVRGAETRLVIGEGATCLATPFKPDVGFSVANAMNRNKIVYALSRVTLVVACEEGSGGTWQGATEALRKRYGRVAVWTGTGAEPGNRALVALGASAVQSTEELWTDAEVIGERITQPEQLKFGT